MSRKPSGKSRDKAKSSVSGHWVAVRCRKKRARRESIPQDAACSTKSTQHVPHASPTRIRRCRKTPKQLGRDDRRKKQTKAEKRVRKHRQMFRPRVHNNSCCDFFQALSRFNFASASTTSTIPIGLSPILIAAVTGPTTGTVILTGARFVPGVTVVNFNGITIIPTNVTVGSLTFTLPAGTLPGTYTVTVTTPAGTSNAITYTVPACTLVTPTLSGFAVLGGSTVTNTGPSVINGNLGVSPGSAVTGFPPGTVTGTIHAAPDAVAAQAQTDRLTLFNALLSTACTATVSGDIGGQTFTPGVYCTAPAQPLGLTGPVTLNALGNPNASFVFNIGTTLTTASGSSVVLIGGAQACNVFFTVGSSATLGTATAFNGTIVAHTSITATTGATDSGRLLAGTGAVTLDTNTITVPTCSSCPT